MPVKAPGASSSTIQTESDQSEPANGRVSVYSGPGITHKIYPEVDLPTRITACTFVGFDSAWADNPRAPGAICSVLFDGNRFVDFRPPELVGFEQALAFIDTLRRPDLPTLLALDQPTIVPNETAEQRPRFAIELGTNDTWSRLFGGRCLVTAKTDSRRRDGAPKLWRRRVNCRG